MTSPLYNKLKELTIFVYSYFEKGCRKKCTFYRSQLFAESNKSYLQNASKRVPWILPLHWLHTAIWKTRTGLDWIGVQSPVQLFHLVGYTPVPVHPPHLLQYAAFLARSLKVARYSFSGPIPPKFEHKLRRHKQSFGKIATTVVLDEDENLLWSRLQRHRSCHSNEITLLPILLAAIYLDTGNCSSKIIHGSFFLQ